MTALLFALAVPVVAVVVMIVAVYRQARIDQTQPVDAIVVLGTAQYNGRPGPVLRARLDHALDIYTAGYAPLIVVTGGRQPGDQFTEAEAARDYLLEQGVSPEVIVLENSGLDTWQSMQGVAQLLPADHRRILLVSDGFHLLRLKLMARDVGLVPAVSAAPKSPIWHWGPAEGFYVVREVAAIAVYLRQTR